MALRVVAALAGVALLAGCAPAPQLPAGLRPADVQALIEERNAVWWQGMFKNEPQPVVEPIKTVSASEENGFVRACVLGADLPGVEVSYEGALSVNADGKAAYDGYQRQVFICTLEYPFDLSDPAALGYLSLAQSDYLYDYYRTRLVPCLESIGFSLDERPSRDTFVAGGPTYWMPYYDMVPVPTTAAEWNLIDLRCPPPPYLAHARPELVGQ